MQAHPAGLVHEETLVVTEPRAETVHGWAERMNATPGGRPQCACGCGTEIVVLPRHRSIGLPRYVREHAPNGMSLMFDRLRKQGYRFVSDVAKALGVSGTTLRRMEAAGAIPKARRIAYARGKEARVYTDVQVRRIVRSRARVR